MKVQELRKLGVAIQLRGDPDTHVHGVHHDSRRVKQGDLFVALSGQTFNGSDFLEDALARGATAVLSEDASLDSRALGVPVLLASDARRSLSLAATAIYGQPWRDLTVVGVTGTNGKTTCVHLLHHVLGHERATRVGTLGASGAGIERPLRHTTPEADELARLAVEMRLHGQTHAVLEVSSHALELKRVEDIPFKVAAFSNLSREHLDFHGGMENYARAKARLFRELQVAHAVLNADDAYVSPLIGTLPMPTTTFSKERTADVRGQQIALSRRGIQMEVQYQEKVWPVSSTLIGEHNVDNILLAFACCTALGEDAEHVARRLSSCPAVPGRLERVPTNGTGDVFIDYAHTPAALAQALTALRAASDGALIAVVGAGGGRDKGKRPLMGKVAAELADKVIVTTDNPRYEDPEDIMRDILAGIATPAKVTVADETSWARAIKDSSWRVASITDRRFAIAFALALGQSGASVVIAGKGHESYQEVRGQRIPFSDLEVVKDTVGSGATSAAPLAAGGVA